MMTPISRKFLALLLIAVFVVTMSPFERARSQSFGAEDFISGGPGITTFGAEDFVPGASAVTNIIGGAGKKAVIEVGPSLFAQLAGKIKEYGLDPLVDAIAASLIRQLFNNINNWVRNGFQGQPLFVTDFEGFLAKSGDEAFGIYVDGLISKGKIADICSPFRADAILGLVSAARPTARCTLSRFIDNINSVYNRFDTYGWTGFAGITTSNVANNAFGSILLQMDQLSAALLQKTTALKAETQAGGGFLSWKECTKYVEDTNNVLSVDAEENPIYGKKCAPGALRSVTPGSYVKDKLGISDDYVATKAAVADEINEMISVVATQLLNMGLDATKPKGLLGGRNLPPSDFSGLVIANRVEIASFFRVNVLNPEAQYLNFKQRSANSLSKTIQVLEELDRCQQNQSQQGVIGQHRLALGRVKNEAALSDSRLRNYEGILRTTETTLDPGELSNLGRQTILLQDQARSAAEIETAQNQSSESQNTLDSALLQLKTCKGQKPFMAFSAVPSVMTAGRPALLSWSGLNVSSCSASGGWSGSKTISGEEALTAFQTRQYGLACVGSEGTASASTTINVIAP